jgi:hypothetical protein
MSGSVGAFHRDSLTGLADDAKSIHFISLLFLA